MKIHYRESEEGIEIVRCVGSDSRVVIPESIAGKPVTKAAPYAFSARKDKEEIDVEIYQTDQITAMQTDERLLAGEIVEEVILPATMQEIGRYIFYGCRKLRRLEFSDNLTQIGSGAFTVCSSLEHLVVHLQSGNKSCVKEILGELWQRMDVTFLYESKESANEKAELIFPGHYEEAVENTPARILYTQHHGSGNNYRQCFLAKELDYRKYDDLFSIAAVMEKLPVLIDLCFGRLLFPVELAKKAETEYKEYIRSHLREIVDYLIENEQIGRIRLLSEEKLWTSEGLDRAIECASNKKKTEILSILMNERRLMQPVKQKRFVL